MGLKEKVIGILLIVVGAWPFLLMIEAVNEIIADWGLVNALTPGEIAYQVIVILLGVLLLISLKPRMQRERH